MGTMKAWRIVAVGEHRLVEAPMPEVKDDRWVLVKVKVVQPSVTDIESVIGEAVTASVTFIPKFLAEGKPLQRGHEYCGEVVEVGKAVTSLRVGDRVSSPGGITYCGTCPMCTAGKRYACQSPLHMGSDLPGAFAEYMYLPEWSVVKMPETLTDNEVAALQPLASCVGIVANTQIGMGNTVVVLGQGSMGFGVLQIAKLSGAGLLIAVDKRQEILNLSKQYGADYTINASETNVVEEVFRLTDGLGADVVYDAAGGSPKVGLSGHDTVQQAFQMAINRGGKVVQVAGLLGTLDLDSVFVRKKRIKYLHLEGGSNENLQLAAFWVANGRVQVRPQISHVLHGLENLPEAIAITENKAKYGATNPAQVVL
jgi:threonine dehydrogenase-like Zn-dependent dehydrogenase